MSLAWICGSTFETHEGSQLEPLALSAQPQSLVPGAWPLFLWAVLGYVQTGEKPEPKLKCFNSTFPLLVLPLKQVPIMALFTPQLAHSSPPSMDSASV